MKGKFRRVLSLVLAFAMALSVNLGEMELSVQAAGSVYKEVIEFEDAYRFEQNGRNRVDASMFSGYSGSGYVYLEAGWGEVGFTVPYSGEYAITLVTNSDQYKENWLYLDSYGAGTLYTNGNYWQENTYTVNLSAGEHKFGVSTNWGYVALDYAVIEAVNVDAGQIPEATPTVAPTATPTAAPTATPTPKPTATPTAAPTATPTAAPTATPTVAPVVTPEPVEDDAYYACIEFEDENRYEENGGNCVDNTEFDGYSGDGYVYLKWGWAEVGFEVPEDGTYTLTLVSNADQYKENWLYLDDNGVGTLYTEGNKWNEYTAEYDLKAGEHKFGVSSSWGYVALDYVTVAAVEEPEATATPEPTATPEATEKSEATPVPGGAESSGKGMYVANGKLYDGNGNEFIMRGINVAHAWYTDYTETSINAIADLGANCVRVVCADGTQWTKTTVSEIETIIELCEANGLVCILEVHDHTGYDDVSRLNTAVDYWLSMKDLLNDHKDYVIVNIANEWLGTWNNGYTWTSAYQSAIKTMRNAGLENVLMIDAAGYGQETSTCIDNCQSVYAADTTGNTMFSIHMYSVAGKDAQTVKSAVDSMLSKNVAFCIGEFGDFQNGGDVDEATIMSYCTEKEVGYVAWSWKGNGGTDVTLDLSGDWAGTKLTDWGKYVFYAEKSGIQATSRMAYSLAGYGGSGYDGEVTAPEQPDAPENNVDTPSTDVDVELTPGLLTMDGWYISGEGDESVSTVTTGEALSNGGIRMNFDLKEEPYPYLSNMFKGLDLSANSTIDVVVRNNNLYAVQLQPVFKVGEDWTWKEYDLYQTVPAQSTVMLSFDLTGCADRDEVMAMMFRLQGAGSSFAGTLDVFSVVTDYDYTEDAFAGAIAELNRPKSADFFTWTYAETSWTNTVDYSCDKNGVVKVSFADITTTDAAGPQTETRPGTGTGLDMSPYGTMTCSITNNADEDIHITLVMKTEGDWTWQENAGTVDGVGGERIIAAGETVDVVYELQGSEWKSAATDWAYTGELVGSDDVRAIAFKIYAGEGDTVSGEVTISDMEFNF